jgi:hypothetical protein
VTGPQTIDVADPARVDRSLGAVARRRVDGSFDIDAWGLDADAVSVLSRLVPTFAVRTTGTGRVPDGPALLLWRGGFTGWVHVAVGVGAATGRPVRFTGMPDVAPVVGVLRRLGGVGGDLADLRGLLRAGNLVAMRLDTGQALLEESLAGVGWVGEQTAGGDAVEVGGHGLVTADVGVDDWLPDDEVEAAVAVGVPVVPVVVHAPRPWQPWARVHVGEPVPTRTRRSARTLAEVSAGVAASFAGLD